MQMKKFINLASDTVVFSALAFVVFLIMVGIYYMVFKTNASKMSSLYEAGSQLSNENMMERFVRKTAERYFELALLIPDFNFDTPMYFDRYGNLVPIGHGYDILEVKQDSHGVVIPMESSAPVEPTPTVDRPETVPNETVPTYIPPTAPGKTLKEIEDEYEAPEVTEVTYTDELTEEEAKKRLENALHDDSVFLGMNSKTLRNTGIGVSIEIGKELIQRSKMGKKAGEKASKLTKEGVEKIIKTSKRAGRKSVAKIASKNASRTVLKTPARLASKGSGYLFSRVGPRKFAQMGLMKSKNAASKALKKAGSAAKGASKAVKAAVKGTKAGIAGAKAAAKAASFGTKVATKASAIGPFAIITTAFDITGLALDMTDAGGYMMLDTFKQAADSINKEYAKMFAKSRMKFPQTIGPIDKQKEKASDEYLDMVWEETVNIIKKDLLNYQNKARDEYVRVNAKNYMIQINPLLSGVADRNSNEKNIKDELKKQFNKDVITYFTDVNDRITAINDGLPVEIQTKLTEQATINLCKKLKEKALKEDPSLKDAPDLLPKVHNNYCVFTDSFEKQKLKRMNDYAQKENSPYKTYIKVMTRYAIENPDVSDAVYNAKDDEMYDKYVNPTLIEHAVMKEWCLDSGGKILKDGKCTYNSEKGCDSHYKLLGKDKIDGIYAVWDPKDKVCKGGQAAWAVKLACNNSGISYNPRTGRCQMTEKQCLQKGGKWDKNKKDCIVPDVQEVMEFIFPLGSTGYRFFKQVLDMDQYLPCPKGTTDHGYVCNKNSKYPNCEVYGSKWYNSGGRCHNILKYRTADCPTGYTNNGATCGRGPITKLGQFSILRDCPSGYKNSGFGTCIPKVMGRGFGVTGGVVNKYYCPSSHPKHHGVWGAGWCDNWPKVDWPHQVRTTGERKKPKTNIPYSKSKGNEVPRPSNGVYKWEKCGALYYPKCPPGMTNDGCNICRTSGNISRTDFKPCKSGYKPHTKGRCRVDCEKKFGKDFRSDGESCHRPVSTLWGTHHMKCFKPGTHTVDPDWYKPNGSGMCYQKANSCPSGYALESDKSSKNYRKCVKGTSVRIPSKKSITTRDYACPPGYEAWAGRCRTKCPKGWTDDGFGCRKKRKIAISTADDNRYGGGNTFD